MGGSQSSYKDGCFIPINTNVKTPALARLFVEQLYRLYGLPTNIVSDRDTKFNSHFWRAVFHRLDTQLNMSTSNHPETGCQMECVNQVLEDMLQEYVTKKQTNWEYFLPIWEFAYNMLLQDLVLSCLCMDFNPDLQ